MGVLLAIARRNSSRAPMELLQIAEVSEHSGVSNDFRGKSGKRQVTVVSRQSWEAVCSDPGILSPPFGVTEGELPWTARRANLLIDGVDLKNSSGKILSINKDVLLEIFGETTPCNRMDEERPGLRKALTPDWRGGVMCKVIRGGSIAVGDMVTLIV